MRSDHASRMQRALMSLEGLSVGDGFGQGFFAMPPGAVQRREIPYRLFYTDDTEMAIGIVEVLQRHQRIDQDDLAETFGRRYRRDMDRGYGGMAHRILREIGEGQPWREVSKRVFGGTGSMGNGGAMRVAPLAAYFADDLDALVENARLSAEVTHAHPEGVAGAVAVALAAGFATAHRGEHSPQLARDLFEFVLERTPAGATRTGIEKAMELPRSSEIVLAAGLLGNGENLCAHDTVPFCLWCAARHFDHYEEAIWATLAGDGDMDTNCAIVGGIVSLSDATHGVPGPWLALRESIKWESSPP